MLNGILRLAALGAVLLVVSATSLSAQLALPRPLSGAPAYTVIDRLLQGRSELALTGAQVDRLTRLSADLYAQQDRWQKLRTLTAKPWVTAGQRPLPQSAWKQALAVLTPEQQQSAVRFLEATL